MKRYFSALFITNFWGTLNDNFLKTLACFIAIEWVEERYQSLVVSLAAAALVLPYIFCSPLAGRLTQLFSKLHIVRMAKVVELPIMGIAIVGFWLHSIALVLLAIFLMGLQSSLYSPAKYGLVRDIGGIENVSNGMGGMESFSFLGMLSGTVLASVMVDLLPHNLIYLLLVVFALFGLISSLTLRAAEEKSSKKERINPIAFLRETHQKANNYLGLNPIVYTLSLFWWLAASLQIGLLIYCKQSMGLSAMQTGLILSLAAVGISMGCLVAGWIGKKSYQMGYVAFYGWLMAALLLLLFFVPLAPIPFAIILFLTANVAGFFKTPMDAEIQRIAKGPFLNTILAYFNQVSFLFILGASATFALLTELLPNRYLFLMLAIALIIAPIYLLLHYRPFICYTCRVLLHKRYKIAITGLELLESECPHLIIPNHQAVVDPMILFGEFYKHPISPLVDEAYFGTRVTRHILGLFHAVMVPDLKKSRAGVAQVKELHQIVTQALHDARNILFYPSGHISLNGMDHIGARSLTYQVVQSMPHNTQVLCVRTRGLWGSMWSRKGRKKTPPLGPTLLKALGWVACGALLFRKRRPVSIEIVDMTETVRAWSQEDKVDFNKRLEEWYNT